MEKIKAKEKTCHGCGLENGECESDKKHIPHNHKIYPCMYCVRNEKRRLPHDFYDERWTLSDNEAFIEE